MKVALVVGAEVPQRRPHLLDRLAQVTLVGAVRVGVIEAGAVEALEVLVVRRGAAADRRALRELRLQRADRGRVLLREVGLLHLLAQLVERLLARDRIGPQRLVADDLVRVLVEAAVAHEAVIEGERDRVAVRRDAGGQHLAQLGDVGRLRADALDVAVAELVEVADLRRGEIARRRLRLLGAGCAPARPSPPRASRARARSRRRAPRSARPGRAAGRSSRVRRRAAHVGVGRVVLLGLEVDVRQRRLRRRADHPGDVAEVVGQRREHRDVADRRRARGGGIDRGEHAEALARVQRDVGRRSRTARSWRSSARRARAAAARRPRRAPPASRRRGGRRAGRRRTASRPARGRRRARCGARGRDRSARTRARRGRPHRHRPRARSGRWR